MDSGTVKTFTDAAAQLLPALIKLASDDPAKRTDQDDALIRQLRVATGAISHALMETPRQFPQMPAPPRPPDVQQAA